MNFAENLLSDEELVVVFQGEKERKSASRVTARC